MSELRRNLITGHWVILAENRGARPQEIALEQSVQRDFECPFCEGREERTPGETLVHRALGSQPDGPGWRVRVIPNKYPAVEAEPGAFLNVQLLAGLHEVIVESPQHLASVTALNDVQFEDVLDVYRERLAALRNSGRFTHATLFKNSGTLGGATLSHVHSQLIATRAAAEVFGPRPANFEAHFKVHGNCPLCEMVGEAVGMDQRIVAETNRFVAFCPMAARFAYETWIAPRRHSQSFELIERETTAELAALFKTVLVKVERIVKLPAYNYIVHTAPFDTSASNHYHWHIEILPRIANLAGFELGTGCYINAVLSERAAAELRRA